MQWLYWPFWSDHERRLRAGWRIFIHFGLWVYGPAILHDTVGRWFLLVLGDLSPGWDRFATRVSMSFLTLVAVLVGTWLAARFLDHRPFAALGFRLNRDWWADMGFGMVLGAALMTFIFLVEYGAGWVTIQTEFSVTLADVPFGIAILGPIAIFIVIGITEEILSRGYQLRNLAEGLNFSHGGCARSYRVGLADFFVAIWPAPRI